MDFFPRPLLFNSPLSKGVEARKIRMLAVGEFGQHHICDQIPFSIKFLDVSTVPLLSPSTETGERSQLLDEHLQ